MKKELLDLMKSRRSIRKYRKEPVPLEKIHRIMEAGRHAPSGANMQPWIYILVTDNKLKEKIRKEAEKIEKNFHNKAPNKLKKWLKEQKITSEKSFLTEAPALIVVSGFTEVPYWLESTWISIAYILLYAESQSLGTLTYTPSDTSFLNKLLNVPEVYRPVAILPIGYPAEKPSPETRPRKSLEEIAYENKYGIKLKP
ncbi:MAG: nitroreductase family protein [Candidatus Bathyarchaeaceae archaeon]